ncbi:MAG: ABC transporter substrate-binding protein [Pseudomonadota bacterium]|nr:ABC transporter substrate-binding protein [Pseudomonadota bacterium]
MSRPAFTIAVGNHGSTLALKDGRVEPEDFSLRFVDVDPITGAFRRMVRSMEFDIAEMAITTYLVARSFGKRFTALPVFPVRALHHGAILRNVASGVRTPKDLEGRTAGVNRGYTVTTGVWARCILSEQYGVDLSKVTWLLSGDEHVAEYRPPANTIAIPPGKQLAEMLASGEIPAAIGIDSEAASVQPLIANAQEASQAALRERGFYPINHLIVVRDEVLEANPDLAAQLFGLFARAKDEYVKLLSDRSTIKTNNVDHMYCNVMEVIGDPLPYGLAPNRPMLDALMGTALAQRIIPEAADVEGLFAVETRGLTV